MPILLQCNQIQIKHFTIFDYILITFLDQYMYICVCLCMYLYIHCIYIFIFTVIIYVNNLHKKLI